MMNKESPKLSRGYSSNLSTSSEEPPKKHYFISKKFIAPEPKTLPSPTFKEMIKLGNY